MSKTLEQRVENLESVVNNIVNAWMAMQKAAPAPLPEEPAEINSEDDLDSKYGDPEVKKNPPGWKGQSFVGKKFSECSSEFLDELAGFLDWAAKDDKKNNVLTSTGKPRYTYRELDARRARGWSIRNKANTGTNEKIDESTKFSFEDVDTSS